MSVKQQSRQAGALVLLHPLVPHGLVPCTEARSGPGPGTRTGAGAQDAAGYDDVLQQVLGPAGDVAGLGHVPAAAAAPHRWPDGENHTSTSATNIFEFNKLFYWVILFFVPAGHFLIFQCVFYSFIWWIQTNYFIDTRLFDKKRMKKKEFSLCNVYINICLLIAELSRICLQGL